MLAVRQQVENLTLVVNQEHQQELARADEICELKGRYEKSLELLQQVVRHVYKLERKTSSYKHEYDTLK